MFNLSICVQVPESVRKVPDYIVEVPDYLRKTPVYAGKVPDFPLKGHENAWAMINVDLCVLMYNPHKCSVLF